MKVLILNTSSNIGGAAVAAHRLKNALLKIGVEAKMLVRDGKERDSVSLMTHSWWGRKINLFRFYWERLVIFLCNHFNRKELFRVSIANTGSDISLRKDISEADIIHLHWINQGFLSLSDIEKLVKMGKKIVWTMHDMWACTGICHHARNCSAYTSECRNCFYLNGGNSRGKDLSTTIFYQKKRIYSNANMTFVCCSQWLKGKAQKSLLLQGKPIIAIPNPIDMSKFYPQDKKSSREYFRLPPNKELLLFGALNVTDERKGVSYLLKALNALKSSRNIGLVIFGNIKSQIEELVPVPIFAVGYLSDEKEIACLYNAVDAFVSSSLDENLPNTLMESLACGTPCVGFRTGGIPEMIEHKKNGYVAEYGSAEDLARGIQWVLDYPDKEALSRACVEKVEKEYAEEVVARKYLECYQYLCRQETKD